MSYLPEGSTNVDGSQRPAYARKSSIAIIEDKPICYGNVARKIAQWNDPSQCNEEYVPAYLSSTSGTSKETASTSNKPCTCQQEENFTVDPDNLAQLLLFVQQDPRYRRLLFKYDPPKTTGEGLIQYAKTKVDPSHIPVFGIFVKIHRTGKLAEKNEKFKEEAPISLVNDNLGEDVEDAMKIALESQLAKQSVNTGLSLAFGWIPFFKVLPLSSIIKIGAYKGAEKASASRNDGETIETETWKDFKKTKAFLLYLGLPPSDETLYSPWENQRLQLKEYFGGNREEDLYEMEDDFRAMEKEFLEGNEEVPIPMLLLLWNVYLCWEEPYYKRISNLTRPLAGKNIDQRERDLLRDEIALGYDPLYQKDHHIQLASAQHLDSILSVLRSSYSINQQFGFLSIVEEDYSAEDELEAQNAILELIVSYFIEKYQVWMFVDDDEEKSVRAVLLWEPEDRKPAFPLSSFQSLKVKKKIGLSKSSLFFKIEKCAANLRKMHQGSLEQSTNVLHYFSYQGDPDVMKKYEYCQTVLLYNVLHSLYKDSLVYAQGPLEANNDLEAIGFARMERHYDPLLQPGSTLYGYVYIN